MLTLKYSETPWDELLIFVNHITHVKKKVVNDEICAEIWMTNGKAIYLNYDRFMKVYSRIK